jgi:hypothetical protein
MTSKHAQLRIQQRGIPPLVLTWLLDYGQERHDHRGGLVHYLDKQSRRDLERTVGSGVVRRLPEYMDSYAASSVHDNVVVTVGHRYKRLGAS